MGGREGKGGRGRVERGRWKERVEGGRGGQREGRGKEKEVREGTQYLNHMDPVLLISNCTTCCSVDVDSLDKDACFPNAGVVNCTDSQEGF